MTAIGDSSRDDGTTGSGDPGAARADSIERLGLLDAAPTERFDRLTRIARELFGVKDAMVTLLDDRHQHVKAHTGPSVLPIDDLPLADALCTETIRADRTLVVEDASQDARFASSTLVTGEVGMRFYAGHPISVAGTPIGALCIFDDTPRELDESDEVLLAGLAILVEGELDPAVEADVARAESVQRGLLPHSRPDLVGWDLAGESVAALDVGGDLFDWYETPGGLSLFLVDPIGRGSGAAIIAATVRGMMRSLAGDSELVTAVLAASTALEDLEADTAYASLFAVRLHADTGELTWVDAGHGLSVIVRGDGSVERIDIDSSPLGTTPPSERTEHSARLHTGDCLISVTDGALDLLSAGGDPFEQLTRRARSTEDAGTLVAGLADEFRHAGVLDDATVVVLRRTV